MIAGVPPMPTGTKYRAPLSRFICTTSVSTMSVYPSWGLPILTKNLLFSRATRALLHHIFQPTQPRHASPPRFNTKPSDQTSTPPYPIE